VADPGYKDTWTGYITSFETQFPSVEARHTAAMQLAIPDIKIDPPIKQYAGRNFLTAHWGDDTSGLLSAGGFLHRLK
jgi:formylmethanofuran dehydrogenase subunit A